jgi:hypothetical protein
MDEFHSRCGARVDGARLTRWLAVALIVAAAPASAESGWHTGLDFHGTDAAFAARRPIGITAGLRRGAIDGSVVIDPMLLVLGWEMLDLTIGHWNASDRVELLTGWRQTSGGLSHGRRYDEAWLLGADVAIASSRVRVSFGAELVISLWRHGGHIPSDTITFAANPELGTRMAVLLHLRFEVGGFR